MSIQVSATADDPTSGVASLESSLDGGVYQASNAPVSFADGYHTIQFRAVDKAGNQTETSVQEFYVDTIAPAIDLPPEWEVNETITYIVQDDGSGLSALRIVIEDEDEKFVKLHGMKSFQGTSSRVRSHGMASSKTARLPLLVNIWAGSTQPMLQAMSAIVVPSR